MMDGEKRVVTFMGESGKRAANIIWLENFNMFKVDCELDGVLKIFKFFMDESKAQQYAEQFTFGDKNGNE